MTKPVKIAPVDLKTKVVAIDKIQPHPDNPRVHTSRNLVVESVATHGAYKPLIVQKSTGNIIAGNGTWEVLVDAGHSKVSIIELDVDDAQAKRIMLVDNRSAELSAYNEIALGELLAEFEDDFTGTGWTEGSAGDLLALIGGAADADDLADAHDEYDPDDPNSWPRVSIPLAPDLYGAWTDLASDYDGDNTQALRVLMIAAGHVDPE